MVERFARLAAVAAAFDRRDEAGLVSAAAELVGGHGAEALRELLRQLHLFRGFPRTVQALNLLAPLLDGAPGGTARATGGGGDPVAGEALFRRLYGADADQVLPHLRRLDPLLGGWILDHAYGRVLGRPGLEMVERERLAALLLAADGCWKQWQSHARICLRLGVAADTLAADAGLADWLAPAARRRLREELRALPADPHPAPEAGA